MNVVLETLRKYPSEFNVFFYIGLGMIVRLGLKFLSSLYIFLLRPSKNLNKFGKWAIVTGATDGIGKGLAMELAKKGMNVVLISRTQARLDEVKKLIEEKYTKVQIRTLAIDFNDIEQKTVQFSIQKLINDIQDVGVLFNNVGVSYDFPQFFDQLSDDHVQSLIKLNVSSTTIMTKLVLPGMAERKRGVIVNLSSGSARLCVPLLSEYSAAKKYIEQFTECLAEEYKAKNVHIQCHTPMFVSTKLAKIRSSSFFIPSPASYAKAAVANLGYETIVSPYWPHALQIWLYESVPTFITSKLAMSTHLSLRKRALKKLEQKKTQ